MRRQSRRFPRHSLPIRRSWFSRRNRSTPPTRPHPGAARSPPVRATGDVELFDLHVASYAARSGVPILSVEYRLAPEATGTTPVEDVYSGLAWLLGHAGEHGVDPARIALMGESAGAGLAAGAAILARDDGRRLARQILIYPMLDDRTDSSPPGSPRFSLGPSRTTGRAGRPSWATCSARTRFHRASLPLGSPTTRVSLPSTWRWGTRPLPRRGGGLLREVMARRREHRTPRTTGGCPRLRPIPALRDAQPAGHRPPGPRTRRPLTSVYRRGRPVRIRLRGSRESATERMR